MTLKETREFVKGVEGWLTDKEGETLYRLAQNCRGEGVIVEIGSYKGKSTIWLAAGSKDGRGIPVYAVDHHQGSPEHYLWYGHKPIRTFEEFQKNIKAAGLENIVIPIVKTSAEAAKDLNQPVALIFIDGSHDYESVKLDFDCWFPKLIDGGLIVFHDTSFPFLWLGPRKVVNQFIHRSDNFKDIKLIDSLTIAQKTSNCALADKIKNWLMLFYKYPRESPFLLKRTCQFLLTADFKSLKGKIRDYITSY